MKQFKTDNLREKEVVKIQDGKRLGFISEVEFDICTGKITAIIVGCSGGLFGKGKKDIVIPWCNIEKIGEDIILVRADPFLLPGVDCKERCDSNIGSF